MFHDSAPAYCIVRIFSFLSVILSQSFRLMHKHKQLFVCPRNFPYVICHRSGGVSSLRAASNDIVSKFVSASNVVPERCFVYFAFIPTNDGLKHKVVVLLMIEAL